MPDYGSILAYVCELLADILGAAPDAVPVDEPFDRLGLASRDAVMLSGDLQDWLGRDLPPSLLYEHPTPAQLAAFLAAGEGVASRDGIAEAWRRGSASLLLGTSGAAETTQVTGLSLDDFAEGRV